MRVKVLDHWADVLPRTVLGSRPPPKLFISPGKEYLVYGLSLPQNSTVYGRVLLCEVIDDDGNLISTPIDIFEVTDRQIPAIWRAESRDGSFFLWPETFLRKFFFDDLSEGDPETIDAFRVVREAIEDANEDKGTNGTDAIRPLS
jgi:hypothetical protein